MLTPEEMSALHERAFADQSRPWSASEIANLLNTAFVFQTDTAAGFALTRVIADEAELLTIATDPSHRRMGMAREILGQAEATASLRGAKSFFLEVAEDNLAARALYRSAGFSEQSRRKKYYARENGPKVDALILAKPL